MKILLTSTKCSCCVGYNKIVQEIDSSINVVDAGSTLGRELIKEHNIIGLPALIYEDKVIIGKFNKTYLYDRIICK